MIALNMFNQVLKFVNSLKVIYLLFFAIPGLSYRPEQAPKKKIEKTMFPRFQKDKFKLESSNLSV